MKFTTAQAALLHAAESLGVSAIASVVAAMYQYFILHGFNLQGLIGVGVVTFVGAFSMLYKTLQNNPNLAPAIADTVGEIKGKVTALEASHSALQSVVSGIVQATQQAPVQAQPVQQQQFVQPAPTPVPQFSFQPSSTYPQVPAVQAQ